LPGICSIRIVDCIFILQNPCLYFPCDFPIPDPWEIYEILDPLKIPDIRRIIDVKVDPEVNVLPFPVNENVVGLQFYEPVKEVLNEKVMVLKNDLELDPEFAKENGLAGNMVPAGKYPVLFNEKTKNYNVLVSVK
jgi:hypothetical protein